MTRTREENAADLAYEEDHPHKPFTVILCWSDIEETGEPEIITAHVEAEDRADAIEAARTEATAAHPSTDSDDWGVVAVFIGHAEEAL